MKSKKIICVLMAILLTVVMLPFFEASAESEISSGQAIINLDYNEPLEFDINMEKLMDNPRFVEILILIGEDYPKLKEFFLLSTVINDTKIDHTLIWGNECIDKYCIQLNKGNLYPNYWNMTRTLGMVYFKTEEENE